MNSNNLIKKQQVLQKCIKDELSENFETYSSTYTCCTEAVLNLSKKQFDKWLIHTLHPAIIAHEGQFSKNSSYLHYLTIQYKSVYKHIHSDVKTETILGK